MVNIVDKGPEAGIISRYAPKLSLVTFPQAAFQRAELAARQPAALAKKAADFALPPNTAHAASGPGAPTIAFVSPKGGAGKSTAALLLALGLADRGSRVALIDTDPNGPLLHWSAQPGRPERVAVHAARAIPDLCDAVRAARRWGAEWIIVDTEGSARGAMVFAAVQLDLVITPLAGSHLDAREAVKAAELVAAFGRKARRPLRHRCLLTRVPAAVQTRGLRAVVEHLRENKVELLPVALVDKEAFRLLFATGGSLHSLAQSGVWGLAAAEQNARAYTDAVLELIGDRAESVESAELAAC